MKRYEVNISEIAQEDLKGIFDYITDILYAPKAAKELLEEMKKSILSLETMPERQPVVSDEYLSLKGIRKLEVRNYIVFYTVNTQHQTVNILRILFMRREWKGLL
ncbi:MAG: type II toxin-antitoxin system RelE/ParE family toxin [Clostridiales bacterium]|nr:type II toxin-antitoxin system RelE/ParE family toxin [Clostridiales bacterium]